METETLKDVKSENMSENIATKPTKMKLLGTTKDKVWLAVWVIALTLLVLKFAVYQQVNVVGESMEPNYHTSELLLVNTVDKNINRGQVVAAFEDKELSKDADYFTRYNARFYLKRVIGLPNEEIEIVGSKVIIYNNSNPEGFALDESYLGAKAIAIEEQQKYYFPRSKIPSGNYFLMGDNRSNSTDSRIRGFFPLSAIFGQETYKYYPISSFDFFKPPKYQNTPLTPEQIQIRDEYRSTWEKQGAVKPLFT
jgi:signal peptidase I